MPFETKQSIGIDLGTSNTVAARQGRVVSALLPSALAFAPNGERSIGAPARARRAIDPRHTLLSTKRLIGAPFTSYRCRRFAERHPYEIVAGAEGRAAIRTRGGDIDPIDVAAALLREVYTPGAMGVITVPAAFDELERAATRQAAADAGIEDARLIEEPVATAIAYLARSSLRYAAIYDLGGGTFDIAIVDCALFPFTVVAHAGDPYLGGDDVDRALALRVAERVLREERWDLESDAETFARVVAACEDAKLELSPAQAYSASGTRVRSPSQPKLAAHKDRVEKALDAIDPAAPRGTMVVSQSDLMEITRDLVRRTFASCDLALAEAKVTTAKIDAVFLAGGSTMLPGLDDLVGSYFGKRPRADLDPMHVVALGASTAATRPGLEALLEENAI